MKQARRRFGRSLAEEDIVSAVRIFPLGTARTLEVVSRLNVVAFLGILSGLPWIFDFGGTAVRTLSVLGFGLTLLATWWTFAPLFRPLYSPGDARLPRSCVLVLTSRRILLMGYFGWVIPHPKKIVHEFPLTMVRRVQQPEPTHSGERAMHRVTLELEGQRRVVFDVMGQHLGRARDLLEQLETRSQSA